VWVFSHVAQALHAYLDHLDSIGTPGINTKTVQWPCNDSGTQNRSAARPLQDNCQLLLCNQVCNS
jgi:hypothetical protein